MTVSASPGGVPAATNNARPISPRRSAGIFGIVLPPSVGDPVIRHSRESGNPYVDGPRLARLGSADDGSGRLRSYVRPLRAARMAAGPDGLRGSGPEQGSDV